MPHDLEIATLMKKMALDKKNQARDRVRDMVRERVRRWPSIRRTRRTLPLHP